MINSHKNKIIAFYKKHKRMPVYTEIMALVGFKSKNAVAKLIGKLIDEGVLSKDSTGHLIPNKLIGEVPLLGLVEAGIPAEADAELLDTIDISDYLIPNQDSTYLLRVKGDSMIEAGIQAGDMVVAERINFANQSQTKEAKDGDIVIALVDGGWTMKYFRHRQGKIYLEPANKDYKNIYPENELEIAAIVKGVIRKY
ncbi:MAG: LexA family transcriptional regulator [Candidatus Paceibacterota bacterium]